jgi:hypothetical protein
MPKRKPYGQMNTKELAEATAEFDKPWTGPGLPGKPLTAADRAKHRRAGLGGRPRIGEGAKIVPISLERGLLRRADNFAKRNKIKRSQMVAQGLRLLMEQRAKAG